MNHPLRSSLFALSLIAAPVVVHAQDAYINGTGTPAVQTKIVFGTTVTTPLTFQVPDVAFAYLAPFDFKLTGIATKFSATGTTSTLYHTVTLDVLDYNPLDGTSSGLLLGSTSLLVNSANQWIDGGFAPNISLLTGSTYYFVLHGLVGSPSEGLPGWNIGLNTIDDLQYSIPFGTSSTWLDTSLVLPGQQLASTYKADPIFRLDGAPNSAVPEPSTYGLLGGVALLGFAAYRRRFSRKA